MPDLLTGTVTFLFTDVEGSTEHLVAAPASYASSLDNQRRILRAVVAERGGLEVDCRGEEFFFAFPRANDAVAAAIAAQSLLGAESPTTGGLAVRMGIHTGEPTVRDRGYLGLDVHRAARICSLAHGGQVLISRTTRELLVAAREPGVSMRALGSFRLKGFPEPEELFQVDTAGREAQFPAPRSADRTGGESSSTGRERELAAAALSALGRRPTLARLLPRLRLPRAGRRGLAELGWEVRARLPAAPESLRGELAELGGDLFAGSRSVVAVDRYLAGVDRKRLARRLAEDTELGVLSKRAAADAEATAGRLRLVNALADTRESADRRIDEIGVSVERLCTRVEVGAHGEAGDLVQSTARSIRSVTSDLDQALEATRAAVRAEGRLRRTRHRGIYRRAEHYVVPYFDEVGLEHERDFDTLSAARVFRDARREDEKRKIDFPGGPAPHDAAYRKSLTDNPPP
jgi:class 3 adenylate cyclase